MRRARGWRSRANLSGWEWLGDTEGVYYSCRRPVLLVPGVEYGIDAWISIAWRI